MIKFAQLKAELLVALKQDIEQFSDSNPVNCSFPLKYLRFPFRTQ